MYCYFWKVTLITFRLQLTAGNKNVKSDTADKGAITVK